MPIVIDDYQSDGAGGFFVKFNDPSQSLTGYIHATTQMLSDFVSNFRTIRGASPDKLQGAIEAFESSLPDATKIQKFQQAYEEMVADIVDLRERGLRHNTPASSHASARAGNPPDKEWLIDDSDDAFKQFRDSNR